MSDIKYRHVELGSGSITVAFTVNKDTNQFVYGISLRSPLDQFYKKKGNMIAKNRLETYMFSDEPKAEKLQASGKAGTFASTASSTKEAVDELVERVVETLPNVRWVNEALD